MRENRLEIVSVTASTPRREDSLCSFDGLRLHYEDHGVGEPVLMLHGIMGDSQFTWVRPGIVEALCAAGHRVLLLDARGHGRSQKPHDTAAYGEDAMARDCQALLDHLELNAVDVVGYSMGAYTGSRLVLRDARPRSLVLGGAGPVTFKRSLALTAAIADALEAHDPDSIGDREVRAWREHADATGVDRTAMAALFRAPRVGEEEELAKIAVPAIVLTGEHDEVAGSGAELAAAIPTARALSVPGSHFSKPDRALDHPAFIGAVLDFLSRS